MKTTRNKPNLKKNLIVCSILMAICGFLSSCSLNVSPEEKVKETFETFMKEMKDGNPQEAVHTHCRGQIKENLQGVLALSNMFGENATPFANYKGILKIELVPDYSDVALLVADIGDEELMTYIFHLDESEEWKIYYAEKKDLTLIKSFISDEMLQNIGIFTLSDSDMEDLF